MIPKTLNHPQIRKIAVDSKLSLLFQKIMLISSCYGLQDNYTSYQYKQITKQLFSYKLPELQTFTSLWIQNQPVAVGNKSRVLRIPKILRTQQSQQKNTQQSRNNTNISEKIYLRKCLEFPVSGKKVKCAKLAKQCHHSASISTTFALSIL